MKKLYMDSNVIAYMRAGSHAEINQKCEDVSSDHQAVFSSAHIEEIAASGIRDKAPLEIIERDLDFLSEVTGNNCLRSRDARKVELLNESPRECYRRVTAGYWINDIAEEIDSGVIRDANVNPSGDPQEMNNVPPEKVLNHVIYRELIGRSLINMRVVSKEEAEESLRWTFSDLRERFICFQIYVNLAANLLEKIGYYREQEHKSRSRLHDVSHIIYGAYSDIFVSADKKILKKAMAIYSLLEISTKVLDLNAFSSYEADRSISGS